MRRLLRSQGKASATLKAATGGGEGYVQRRRSNRPRYYAEDRLIEFTKSHGIRGEMRTLSNSQPLMHGTWELGDWNSAFLF